jgi:hypothetical protein
VQRQSRVVGSALGGLLLALAVGPPAHAAEITYKIEPIFKLGDRVGDVNTKPAPTGVLLVLSLNDQGQLLVLTGTAETKPAGAALFQYAAGQFTTIAAPGKEGPVGVWPNDLVYNEPSSMNQAGNVVFAAARWHGGDNQPLGTFLWDAQSGKMTPIVVKGTPATDGLIFDAVAFSPVINNQGEIAFPGWGQDKPNHFWGGIFVRRTDGSLERIVLTDDKMPDGRKLVDVHRPTFNDAGVVAFLGAGANDPEYSAYLWEKGAITPVAVLGQDAPEGGKIRDVRAAMVNNKNGSALVIASRQAEGKLGLYRFAEGKLTALVVPGQTLTDGGVFSEIPLWYYGVSRANELGQHAFLAKLQDGSTAAYLLEPDGTVKPILKSGQVTDLGKITVVGRATRPSPGLGTQGWGISLNRQGQVALTVSIDGGPTTLVLLTPNAP